MDQSNVNHTLWMSSDAQAHLAVVELLDDRFVLFVDVTYADELSLTVSLKEALSESLHHRRSRASAGNRAVLNVPEHPDGGQRFLRATFGRTCRQRFSERHFLKGCTSHVYIRAAKSTLEA